MSETDFPELASVLPHRGDSLLIDRIVAYDGDSTVVLATVRKSSWLSDGDGDIPCWIAIDLMAQCIGVHEGIGRPPRRTPPVGYVVSASRLKFYRERLHPHERLRIQARQLRRSVGLGIASYACEIELEQNDQAPTPVAEGTLNLLIPSRDS